MTTWEIKMMLMLAGLAVCLVMLVVSHICETKEAEELRRMECEELKSRKLRRNALETAEFFAGNVLR